MERKSLTILKAPKPEKKCIAKRKEREKVSGRNIFCWKRKE
jgi:hypothetical protein